MKKFKVEYSKNKSKYKVLFESDSRPEAEKYYFGTTVSPKDAKRLVFDFEGEREVITRSGYKLPAAKQALNGQTEASDIA